MKSKKIILFTLALIGISTIAFLRSKYLHTVVVDEAFIFFRYAENVVKGNGFVWNIGELPVEGYSSFMYLVIFIFGKVLSLDPIILSLVVGVVSSTLTLYLTFLIYQQLNPNLVKENIFTVFIIGVTPSFLYWSVAGMETSFYSMFFLLTIYLFLTREIDFKSLLLNGIMFGLLCLIRFEATLIFLCSLLYIMKKKNSLITYRINKEQIIFTLGFSLIFLTYFIWRWIYFGQFLPNTFYAKTGGGLAQVIGGLDYTIISLRRFFGFGWFIIFLILLAFRFKMLSGKSGFLFGLGTVSVIATILIGGDHFYGGRFILPVLPLLLVFIPPSLNRLLNLKTLLESNREIILFLFYFVMAGILVFKLPVKEAMFGAKNLVEGKKETVTVYNDWIDDYIFEWQNGFILMGKELKKISKPDDYIAATPIGAIGYYSKIGVIDMVGIVDPFISKEDFKDEFIQNWIPGHNKGNGAYILSRKPKYIQLVDFLTREPHETPFESSFRLKSIKEIWFSKDFQAMYEFKPVEVTDGWFYNLYVRKDSN